MCLKCNESTLTQVETSSEMKNPGLHCNSHAISDNQEDAATIKHQDRQTVVTTATVITATVTTATVITATVITATTVQSVTIKEDTATVKHQDRQTLVTHIFSLKCQINGYSLRKNKHYYTS